MRYHFEEDNSGYWQILEQPKEGHIYVMGADSASGIPGRNGSAAHIIDVNDFRVVAVLDANITPEILAEEMKRAGWAYNMALLVPEAMYHGVLVIYKLALETNDAYPNVYQQEGGFLSESGNISPQYGWKQTEANRNLCLSLLQSTTGQWAYTDLENKGRGLKNFHLPTLQQMRHFKRNNKGKVEAEHGYSDDLVMSLAMAHAVASTLRRTLPVAVVEKKKTLWDQWKGDGRGKGERPVGDDAQPLFEPFNLNDDPRQQN